MTALQQETQYCLQFYVPKKDTTHVLAAIHETGAGNYPGGLYHKCAFVSAGTGRFTPSAEATPHIGSSGQVEDVEEDKVEIMCFSKRVAQAAVEALLAAHPYEQVPYIVTKGEQL